MMQLGKLRFFALLFILFVSPSIIYKIVWILGASKARGTMCFMGKTLNGQFSSEYPVIRFTTNGTDTVFFNGSEGVELTPGEHTAVLYYKTAPNNARVASFTGLWVDTVIYAAIPMVLLLIVFLHPDIIPRHAIVQLGKKPFVRWLPE